MLPGTTSHPGLFRQAYLAANTPILHVLRMSGPGRTWLHAVSGVEVPVLANERLFTRVNFQ